METTVKEYMRASKALKTLHKRRNDILERLGEKPAWKEYTLIQSSLACAETRHKNAQLALEQRATEMFEQTYNVNPTPGITVIRAFDVEFGDERDVVAWLCENGKQDLLVPDWDAIKRQAIATRGIDCATVVLVPKVIVDL